MSAPVDSSAILTHVDGVALSTRGCDATGGRLGVYAGGGRGRFTGVSVGTLAEAHASGCAAAWVA